MEAVDTRQDKRLTFIFAAKKAKLLAGIFCEAPASFEAGRPLEEMLVFEAAVPFVLRWVMGLTPEAQALAGLLRWLEQVCWRDGEWRQLWWKL